MIELISGPKIVVQDRFGGFLRVSVSMTDLNRSLWLYRKAAGFDSVFRNSHGSFSGLVDEVSGGKDTRVRSGILESSKAEDMVGLFEVVDPLGRSIPFRDEMGRFRLCAGLPKWETR